MKDRALIGIGDLVVMSSWAKRSLDVGGHGAKSGMGVVIRKDCRDIVWVAWDDVYQKPKPINIRWLEYAQ